MGAEMAEMEGVARVPGTSRSDNGGGNGTRSPSSLTRRQRVFLHEYLVDLNATQAAIRAGYSAASAHVAACRLLRNAKVRAEIENAMRARAERTEVSADRVVLEAARIAFADLGRLVRWGKNGVRLLESTALSPDDRAAVASVQERRHKGQLQGLSIKLHDKNAALVTLFRHLGLFEQHDQAVTAKHLDALLDGVVAVLQRYVDPQRVKEAIVELTKIAQDSYGRLEGPR